jgi:hypothetical protein
MLTPWIALAVVGAGYQVTIENHCGRPAYIHSTGNQDGDINVLSPGGASWTEPMYSKTVDDVLAGPSIKVSDVSDVSGNITQLEYFWDEALNTVWYDLSLINGSPFASESIVLRSDWPEIIKPYCVPIVCNGTGPCYDAYRSDHQKEGTHDCPHSNLFMALCETI